MGEMKQVKINVVIDALSQMKPERKKKILESKRVKEAIARNKIEYKDTVVADGKKWNPKKLEADFSNSLVMLLKIFDTRMAFIDKESWSKQLEDKVIKKYNDLVKQALGILEEKAEALEADKPDDKKLKKGVDALAKVDGRAAQTAYASYSKWMKRCEKNWGNIAKLEDGIRQHRAEHMKLSGEAAKHEKAGKDDQDAQGKAEKSRAGADNEQKVVEKLTQKRDTLLSETKSLYRDEAAKLFRELEGVVTQMNQVASFAGEMKRNAQISDDAQKTIQSGKGFFKGISAQESDLKRAQREFEAQMTKLERARNAGGRPSHANLVIPPSVAKNIEGICRDAAGMHKKLKGLYKAAK